MRSGSGTGTRFVPRARAAWQARQDATAALAPQEPRHRVQRATREQAAAFQGRKPKPRSHRREKVVRAVNIYSVAAPEQAARY